MDNIAAGPLREPTLADVLASIWRARYSVLAGGILGALIAYILLLYAVPQYKAVMLVAPPEKDHGSLSPDISAILSGTYGEGLTALPAFRDIGAAAYAGDHLDGFREFEAVLRGPTVARALLEAQAAFVKQAATDDVLFRFMAQKTYDTAEGVSGYLQKAVKIETTGPGAIRRISYTHPDRNTAVNMLESLTGQADRLVHRRALERNEIRLSYLREALENVDHPDHRRILTGLLMKQEHILMMLSIGNDYAVHVIEPPAAMAKPDWPYEKLFYALAILAGLFLGYGAGCLLRPCPVTASACR